MNIKMMMVSGATLLLLPLMATAQITIDGLNNDWPVPDLRVDDPLGDSGETDITRIDVLEQDGNFYLFTRSPVNGDRFVFLDTDENSNTGYAAWSIGADYMTFRDFLYQYTGNGSEWSWEIVERIGAGNEVGFPTALIGSPQSFQFIVYSNNAVPAEIVPDGGVPARFVSGENLNLVLNSSFEDGETGWEDWGNNSYSVEAFVNQRSSGSRSLLVGTTAGGSGQVVAPITPGTTYLLSAEAFLTNQFTEAYIGIHFLDQSGEILQSDFVPIEKRFPGPFSFTVTSTAPVGSASARVWVWKASDDGHWVFVDDLYLRAF